MFNVLRYSNHPFYEVIVLRTITCHRNSSQSINLPSSKLVEKQIYLSMSEFQPTMFTFWHVCYPPLMIPQQNGCPFWIAFLANSIPPIYWDVSLDSRTNGQDHQVIILIYLYFQLLTPTISVNDDCFLCVQKPAVIVGIDKLPGLPPHLVDCMSHEAQPAFSEIHFVTVYGSYT